MSASFFVVVSKLRISYGIFLQDITGYSDAEKCRIVLERHNWDIETAVQDTLNEAEGSQPVFHPLQNSFDGSDEENYSANDINMTQNQVSSARNATGSPTPNTEVQRFGQSWLLWALSVPFLPFRFASSVLCNIFGWIGRSNVRNSAKRQFLGLEDSIMGFYDMVATLSADGLKTFLLPY